MRIVHFHSYYYANKHWLRLCATCNYDAALRCHMKFYVSRKGGTERGGWVHLKGENSMAVTWLTVETPWLVGLSLCMNGPIFWPPFLAKKLFFFQSVRWSFADSHNCLLVMGVVRIMNLHSITACMDTCVNFGKAELSEVTFTLYAADCVHGKCWCHSRTEELSSQIWLEGLHLNRQ